MRYIKLMVVFSRNSKSEPQIDEQAFVNRVFWNKYSGSIKRIFDPFKTIPIIKILQKG